jgi:hypothetical protein
VALLTFLFLLFRVPVDLEPPHLTRAAPVGLNLNVVASTWVVADLGIGVDGSVTSITGVRGGEPLLGSALSSASRWEFTPSRTPGPAASHVTAIFLFRPRGIFSGSSLDLSALSFPNPNRPPIPVGLADPGYMPNSIAEGWVILEVQVSSAGSIQNVRTVQGVPGLTEFTQQAVRNSRFAPATLNGVPVPGTAIVAISYLRPVI